MLEDFSYDPQVTNVKEKENAKKLFIMVAKRKSENERLLNLMEDEFMSNQERDKLKETVKNNTRVIWHLKRQISALLDTFKVSTK